MHPKPSSYWKWTIIFFWAKQTLKQSLNNLYNWKSFKIKKEPQLLRLNIVVFCNKFLKSLLKSALLLVDNNVNLTYTYALKSLLNGFAKNDCKDIEAPEEKKEKRTEKYTNQYRRMINHLAISQKHNSWVQNNHHPCIIISAPRCDRFSRQGEWKIYLATKISTNVANWRLTDLKKNKNKKREKCIDPWSNF